MKIYIIIVTVTKCTFKDVTTFTRLDRTRENNVCPVLRRIYRSGAGGAVKSVLIVVRTDMAERFVYFPML